MVLQHIGTRLRARRQELGLTQSAVAGLAEVSPRFLVQLEGGQGNISVQRLTQVCAALDLSLEHLFRGLGPGGPERIALVGLRGAGKSTVGALLAKRLGVSFVELDRRVEEEAGMSLSELFEIGGASHFRELETRVLQQVLAGDSGLVIATGGSIVTSPQTWAQLRQETRTVWLKASPKEHLQRVRAQGDLRPMRGRPDALRELTTILTERQPLYAQADLCVDTDSHPIGQVVEAVLENASR